MAEGISADRLRLERDCNGEETSPESAELAGDVSGLPRGSGIVGEASGKDAYGEKFPRIPSATFGAPDGRNSPDFSAPFLFSGQVIATSSREPLPLLLIPPGVGPGRAERGRREGTLAGERAAEV